MSDFAYLAAAAAVCAVFAAVIGPHRGWSPIAAGALGLFLGIIGLLIVILVKGSIPTPAEAEQRRVQSEWLDLQEEHWQRQVAGATGPTAQYVPCPSCATPVPARARRCPSCNTELSTCEECGGLIPMAEMMCRFCGTEYYDDEAGEADQRGATT